MIAALLQLAAVMLLGCGLVSHIRRDRLRKRGRDGSDDGGSDGADGGDCGGDGGGGCD